MFMMLAPGETFRHVHNEYSITRLVEGTVVLEADGTRTQLTPGVPAPIGAGVLHVLVNVGRDPAVVECVHFRYDVPTGG